MDGGADLTGKIRTNQYYLHAALSCLYLLLPSGISSSKDITGILTHSPGGFLSPSSSPLFFSFWSSSVNTTLRRMRSLKLGTLTEAPVLQIVYTLKRQLTVNRKWVAAILKGG